MCICCTIFVAFIVFAILFRFHTFRLCYLCWTGCVTNTIAISHKSNPWPSIDDMSIKLTSCFAHSNLKHIFVGNRIHIDYSIFPIFVCFVVFLVVVIYWCLRENRLNQMRTKSAWTVTKWQPSKIIDKEWASERAGLEQKTIT